MKPTLKPILYEPINPKFMRNSFNSALMEALDKNDAKNAIARMDQGADTNITIKCPYDFKMNSNHIGIIGALLLKGAKPDSTLIRQIYKTQNQQQAMPLIFYMTFSNRGDIKFIQTLFYELVSSNYHEFRAEEDFQTCLKNGLPINRLINDRTPLQLCIINERKSFVSTLLKRKADINKQTSEEKFALYFAAKCKDKSISKMLLNRGAEVNAETDEMRTALHEACDHGNSDVVKILLDAGADVNIVDIEGNTPLTGGCSNDLKVLTLMIQKVAELTYEIEFVCRANSKFIHRNKNLKKFYDECLAELYDE